MNQVVLIGNLGKDVELKTTQSGKNVCNFSIGVSRPRSKDGVSDTDWINIVAWEKTAELCGKYLHKGSKVGVVGRLQTRSYDKDGKKVYITEVLAENVEFLSPKESAPAKDDDNHRYPDGPSEMTEANDDELPF